MQAIAEQSTERRLYRIIDLYAADAAEFALRAAAAREGSVFALADALLTDSDDAVARGKLREAVTSPPFAGRVSAWVRELREGACVRPESGACTVATALGLWSWTVQHFRGNETAIDELLDALGPLLAARAFALVQNGDPFQSDLAHVYAARVSAQTAATCAELVFGYRRHLVWDAEGCASCFAGDDVDDLEAIIPGIASGARMSGDVVEADGAHELKAGPCAGIDGIEDFVQLRNQLDGCLTGARLAKERAAATIARSK